VGPAMMATAEGLRRSELGRCRCPGRVPPHQNNSGCESYGHPPATAPTAPLSFTLSHPLLSTQLTMAAQVANGGGGGNAAFKVRRAGPGRENSILTQAAGQGKAQSGAQRQHYCCTRYGTPSPLDLMTEPPADSRRTAVADAIRTVCPTPQCGANETS
jgi:hypothetical protein